MLENNISIFASAEVCQLPLLWLHHYILYDL